MSETVRKLTIEELITRMERMENGDVIGLATTVWEDGSAEEWFGIMKIDLSRLDEESNVWVLQYFGGSPSPHIFNDYNNGQYLAADLKAALEDCDLLQEDGTVLLDIND